MTRRSPLVTLVLVCSTMALLPISITGPSVAVPDISTALHSGLQATEWVVTGYNLAFASCLLVTGTLADRIGRRRMFRMSTALFGVMALVAGLAGNILIVDVARVIAGVGAAAATTSSSAILAARFEGVARLKAFGLFGTSLGVGLAFGPLLGGALVAAVGWRGVFAVPAVVALLVTGVSTVLEESRDPAPGRLDLPGTIAFTAGLAALIFGLVQAPDHGWTSATVLGGFAASAVLMTLFGLVEARREHPMFDLALLRDARFASVCLTAVAVVAALVPLLVYLPSYFSSVDGWSAVHAGAVLLALTGPTLVIPLFAAGLAQRIPLRVLIASALVLMAGGDAWLTVIEPGVSIVALALPLVVIGTGIGLTMSVLDGAAVSSVDVGRAGMAAGMFNTMRLGGETAAIAIAGSLLATLSAASLRGSVTDPDAVAAALTTGRLQAAAGQLGDRGHVLALAPGAMTGALHVVLWATAAFAAALVPVLLLALRPRRQTAAADARAVELGA